MRPAKRLRYIRDESDRAAVIVATLIFTMVAIATHTDGLTLPGGPVVLLIFPAAMLLIDQLRPGSLIQRELRVAAGWGVLVVIAFWLAPYIIASPRYAAGVPFVVGLAAMVARWPAFGLVALVAVTAVFGTFQAYLTFSPSPILDVFLIALWIVLAIRVLVGRATSFVVWPAILLVATYIALCVIDLVVSDDPGVAWIGFRTAIWFLMAVILVPYAGWSRDTLRRAAIGFVAVAAVVSSYAVFRWVIGPSGKEEALGRLIANAINVDPITKELRTFGSFLTAHQLSFWTALMAPFCLGCALFLKGKTRLLAIAAVGLCTLAIFASAARGPLVGMVVGLALVLFLYQFARAFPGIKIGVVGLALAGLIVIGAGGLALSANNPDKFDKYVGIFDPGDDPTYNQRQIKWEAAWEDVEEHPFGQGLGTGGAAQKQVGTDLKTSITDLDNSYLKVAYEQGLLVAVLYVGALLALLATLVVSSLRTESRQAAAIGLGAAGTLVAVMISFWSGLYVESPPALAGWLIVGLGTAHFVVRTRPEPALAAARTPLLQTRGASAPGLTAAAPPRW